MIIVDAHVHLFRPRSSGYPRASADLFPDDRAALADEYLSTAKECGVDRAVVVALSPHHRYLRECLASHPNLFAGVGVHDPDEPGTAVTEDVLAELAPFHGVRVHRLGEPDTRSPEALTTFPLLRHLERSGAKMWFYSTPDQLPLLDLVARAFPRLSIVLNHLGFCPEGFVLGADGLVHADVELPPVTLAPVLRLARHPNVNVMISGEYGFSREPFPFPDITPVVRAIHDAFGPTRMMWATDYPWIATSPGYARMVELPALHLPEIPSGDLAQIMGGTALRLFPSLA